MDSTGHEHKTLVEASPEPVGPLSAEEFRALLDGLPEGATDDDTTILRSAPGRRATRQELLALYEELIGRPVSSPE